MICYHMYIGHTMQIRKEYFLKFTLLLDKQFVYGRNLRDQQYCHQLPHNSPIKILVHITCLQFFLQLATQFHC